MQLFNKFDVCVGAMERGKSHVNITSEEEDNNVAIEIEVEIEEYCEE